MLLGVFFFCFWNWVSCRVNWPGTHYVDRLTSPTASTSWKLGLKGALLYLATNCFKKKTLLRGLSRLQLWASGFHAGPHFSFHIGLYTGWEQVVAGEIWLSLYSTKNMSSNYIKELLIHKRTSGKCIAHQNYMYVVIESAEQDSCSLWVSGARIAHLVYAA